MPERTRAEILLELADDELILGWRNSEWTGIAPFLEEDVAFSSIAQNEIGHARALYELARATSARTRTHWRSTAGRRSTAPLRSSSCGGWSGRRTIARHFLYETADAIRLDALKASDDPEVAASPRRWTARRSTTACTPSSGSGAVVHRRGTRAPAGGARWSSGPTRSASSTSSCGPSSAGA